MDDIIPDDSISRGRISNQSGDYQDGKVSSTTVIAINTTETTKSDERPESDMVAYFSDFDD